MKPILIACEESQAVCIAFRELGHEAYSCDLQDCSGGHPEWHIKEDVFAILRRQCFRMMIGHPPCTRICNSGVLRLYKNGKKENGIDPNKWEAMQEGARFFRSLYTHPNCDSVCIENPVPHGHAMKIIGARYSQTIQPYEFGEDASKRTCLWLRGGYHC